MGEGCKKPYLPYSPTKATLKPAEILWFLGMSWSITFTLPTHLRKLTTLIILGFLFLKVRFLIPYLVKMR